MHNVHQTDKYQPDRESQIKRNKRRGMIQNKGDNMVKSEDASWQDYKKRGGGGGSGGGERGGVGLGEGWRGVGVGVVDLTDRKGKEHETANGW